MRYRSGEARASATAPWMVRTGIVGPLKVREEFRALGYNSGTHPRGVRWGMVIPVDQILVTATMEAPIQNSLDSLFSWGSGGGYDSGVGSGGIAMWTHMVRAEA